MPLHPSGAFEAYCLPCKTSRRNLLLPLPILARALCGGWFTVCYLAFVLKISEMLGFFYRPSLGHFNLLGQVKV